MCLLFALIELQKSIHFSVSVIHVEHGIRGEQSKADAEYVQNICNQKKVPCQIRTIDCIKDAQEWNMTVEEAGRTARYQIFQEESQKIKLENNEGNSQKAEQSVKIAVAHHQNDVAETMLFHLFRGTGVRGLASIAPTRENIIRPLLCLTRDEIEEYLKENHIEYRIDATNQSIEYTRNRIRHQILPEAKMVNDQAITHMAQTAMQLREINEYLDREAKKKYDLYVRKEQEEKYSIAIKLFQKEDSVLAMRIVQMCLTEICGKWKDITSAHLQDIMELSKKQSGKKISLPYDLCVSKIYDTIVIKRNQENKNKKEKDQQIHILIGEETFLPDGSKIVTEIKDKQGRIDDFPKDIYTKWIDYDKIKNGVVIRTRESGDYLMIDEIHTQKLKSYYMNEKIPADCREDQLLIADGNHVIWVIGHRISEHYKVTDNTTKIIEISYQRRTE